MITLFFIVGQGLWGSVASAAMLSGVVLLGVGATWLAAKLLSKTILRGLPHSFTLELPPYRKPQFGKLIVRSIFERTLFVLGRAVLVAAPAGLVIWLLANVTVGEMSLLAHCAAFLDPFAYYIGLDGIILLAFILGWPANEIVIPIAIMGYLATGSLQEMESTLALRTLLLENGWTWLTGACTILFSLMHWPCSTTCLTIYKETHSKRWTLLSMALPTAFGLVACFVLTTVVRLLGLA